MDYKVKLQNNNNVFRDNNTDLQAVLETINNLPEASVSENLDEEIATQEEKIASQDELIANITAALEGKAAGGATPPEYDMVSTTINYTTSQNYGAYIYIRYLATDDNGFIEWKQTENLSGNGTIVIESLSGAWMTVECGQTSFFVECGLNIEELSYEDWSSYKVLYGFGDGAYGVIGSNLEFNISFTYGFEI